MSPSECSIAPQVAYERSTGRLYLVTNAASGATVVITAPAGVLDLAGNAVVSAASLSVRQSTTSPA